MLKYWLLFPESPNTIGQFSQYENLITARRHEELTDYSVRTAWDIRYSNFSEALKKPPISGVISVPPHLRHN